MYILGESSIESIIKKEDSPIERIASMDGLVDTVHLAPWTMVVTQLKARTRSSPSATAPMVLFPRAIDGCSHSISIYPCHRCTIR